jgi:DNA-binding MarR family transcriptional regulator
MTAELDKMDLTASQGMIMGYLAHAVSPPCPRDIEEEFRLSHPTVSGLLSRLEQKGFIELKVDPEDRRIKRIYVLPKGRECHDRMHRVILANEERMVRGFSEEEKEMFVALLKAVFNKEFMTAVQEKSTALLEQHASVKARGNRVELVIDNDALIAMLNDTLQMVTDIYAQIAKAYGNEYAEIMAEGIPQIPNIQLLGKDGIKIEYTLSRGKISAMSMAMDFHLNMAGFAAMLEEELPVTHQGSLDIGIHMNGKMTSIGTTKVTFPTLTEENSLDFVEEMMKLYPAPEVMEEMPEYPYYWADGWAEELPVVNNKFYVPLRDTLTSAYGETVTFGFENGKITEACE